MECTSQCPQVSWSRGLLLFPLIRRRYAFLGSFTVQIFIGKDRVPDPSEAYNFFTAPNQVGFSTVFAYRPDAECDNCRFNADMIYEDSVPLTIALPQYLASNSTPSDWPPQELRVLQNLEEDQVVPFLTKHIEWRIVDMTGGVKSAEEVRDSGLQLMISSSRFDFPTEETPLGKYYKPTLYPTITQGKDGGLPVES